jgi:hypothetical protein
MEHCLNRTDRTTVSASNAPVRSKDTGFLVSHLENKGGTDFDTEFAASALLKKDIRGIYLPFHWAILSSSLIGDTALLFLGSIGRALELNVN